MDTKETNVMNASYYLENKRHSDETFEEYKDRRRNINLFLRRRLRGILFYDSSKRDPVTEKRVPYRKNHHGV